MKKSVEFHQNRNRQLTFLTSVFAVLFCILISGLTYRQLILYKDYKHQEEIQNQRRIIHPGPRGDIYDRKGRILVSSTPRFSVIVYLNELRQEFLRKYIEMVRTVRETYEVQEKETPPQIDRNEIKKTARCIVLQKYLDRVNQILNRKETLDKDTLDRHFRQRVLLPFPLIKDISPEEYARLIEQLPIEFPVQLYTDNARFYPNGSVACHTLGYVTNSFETPENDIPGEDLTTFCFQGKIGRNGLERSREEQLRGISGAEIWVVDPIGFQYRQIAKKNPTKGKRLNISIDLSLQKTAELVLEGKTGAIVLLAVESGEILAIASKPDYRLEELSPYVSHEVYKDINERGAWLNRATQGLYPPGSIFKIITAIASQRIDPPETTTFCTGHLLVGNRKFPCNNPWGHGSLDLPHAIEKSCNVLFYEQGLRAGVSRLYEEAVRFGFHKPTELELPFETRGMLVPNPLWKKRRENAPWLAGDTANMSIGQGYLLVTPLQMACFTASLARGETRTRPTLIYDPTNKNVHGGEPIGLRNDALSAIIEGMEMAAETGTAREIRIPEIRIAAKTGTAQTTSNGKKLSLAWLIAFAPVEKPQVAIAVLIESLTPYDHYTGARTATPMAKMVLSQYFLEQ